MVSKTTCYLSTTIERLTNIFVDVYVGVKNYNFKFPLILYNIMIELQKIKFMQEFTFAINVEYLHSSFASKTTNA